MKLNYQIIKEYFPNLKSERFDWDDCGFIFKLLMKMSLDEVFNWVKSKDTDFDIEKYKQDYEQICLG